MAIIPGINGTRYLCGKPTSEGQCQHVLRSGYQRQRAAAAIEFAMMKPGQPLFEVRAPGFRQQKLLGLKEYFFRQDLRNFFDGSCDFSFFQIGHGLTRVALIYFLDSELMNYL